MSNVDFGIRINLEGGQQVVQQTDRIGQNMGALENVAQRLGAVLGAVAGTALTRGFVQLADSVTVLRNQLSLATGSVQQAEVAYSSLFGIAQRSRQSFTELGATFASISRATSELGISQGRLLTVTEAIGNAIAISGGSAAGAQAALMQLSQGFASGTLRGEELNSVMEQTPRLAKAIAEGLGITIGQLRAMGQEGKLTAQAVLGALEAQAKVLSGEVANSVTTVAQASQVAQNALTALVGEIDRVTGSSSGMASAITAAAESLSDITTALRGVEGAGREVSSVGAGFSVLFETLTVLGANVAYVLKGIGNELGGLAAQAAAIASGQFSEAASIRAAMVAEAEKARRDVDSLTQRVLQARQLRELAAESLRGVDTRAEDARLRRQGVQQQAVAAAVKATAEQLRAAAQEAKKQQSVINDLLGVTDDYVESLRRLLAMRNAGKLSEEQYLAAVDKVIQRQPAVIAAERQRVAQAQEYLGMQELRAEGEREIAEAEAQAQRARQDAVAQVAQQLQGLQDEAEAARLAALLNITHAQAIARVTQARLEDQRTRLVNDPAELAALEQKIALQKQIVQATDERAARDTNAKAADDAAAAWKSTADDIRSALTDAFRRSFESGESFGRAFGQVIEREIKARLASALAGLVTDGILQVVGGAAGLAVSAASGNSSTTNWLQGASTAKNAYDLAAGGSLYAQAGNYAAVYSGQAYGTGFATQQSAMLAAQETGMVSQAGASTMSGWASTAGWVAAAVLAAIQGSSDYSAGFRRQQARESGTALGDASARTADLFSRFGVSDRIADLISGATLTARLFGRAAPRVEAAGFQGTLAGGDFAGDAFLDVVEKGGLFRSDKRYQQLSEVPADLGRLLDGAAAGVLEKAKSYGEALGLPVQSLGEISTSIKIALTDDAEANMQAIVAAVGGYGDALVEGFADAIAPLANYGETTAETFQRIGEAMAGVNDVLSSLGLSAVDASVGGAEAAIALQDLFGGVQGLQQAAGGYLQAFYTDAERTELALASIGKVLGEVGISVPATREEFRALVDAQDLTTDAGRRAFATLLDVSGAFAAVTENAGNTADILAERNELERELLEVLGDTAGIRNLEREALDESNRAIYDNIRALEDQAAILAGLSSVIDDFVGPRELATFRAGEVQSTLAGGGIAASVEQILGSNRGDIVALWQAVGDEGKAAILEAYGAWQDMHEAILAADIAAIVEPLGTTSDALLAAYQELVPAADDLVGSWRSTRDEVQALSDALAEIDGTAAVSAIDQLRDLISQRDGLQGVISGNSDRIFDLRVGQGGRQAVDLLRQREAQLWTEFASTNNPEVARAITQATLQRIALEGELQADVNATQIDALKQQISAAERLRDLAAEMGNFVLSLQAGNLSNLGYQGRLAASESLFANSLTTGEDVQGNATSLLQNAQSVFGGATGAYSDVFESVTSRLRGIGGQDFSSQISEAQAQLNALQSIDETADAQIAALTDLNGRFGVGLDSLNTQVQAQTDAVREQVTELRALQANQERQILQFGLALTRLIEASERTATAVESTADAVELEAAAP